MPKSVLLILDGFGIGKDSPFNAINNAEMPFYRDLIAKYPISRLVTHGEAVGLPDGVMGNSEVGHMTMGAGRIVFQDLTRITRSIRDKSFFKNATLRKTLEAGAKKGRVHLVGLVSDGGVHSHLSHLLALLDLCMEMKISKVSVHAILDGRDTPPDSGRGFLEQLLRHPTFPKATKLPTRARLATIAGRYYAMDRDKRWERVRKAYDAMTGQIAPLPPSTNPLDFVGKQYANGKGDEFIEPVLLSEETAMRDGDSVVFFNFRADRAREITLALTARELSEFPRGRGFKPSAFCGMTVYDRDHPLPGAFEPQSMKGLFGELLEREKLAQFRVAETEKYAHVTFFFNGGREKPYAGEDRVLIESPKDVPTYDLKPEMSAFQVAETAAAKLATGLYDFMLLNFANADMVGHTGNYAAAVRALEALDRCLSRVVGTAEREGYHVVVTADHGNAEEMIDAEGRPHTQHTLNPVPCIWVAPGTAIAPQSSRKRLQDGGLADLMPTLCELMGLAKPPEVTGKSLLC